MMPGYLDDTSSTAVVFDEEGVLRIRDIAYTRNVKERILVARR